MEYTEEVLLSSDVIYAAVSGKIEVDQLATLGKQTRQRAHVSGLKVLIDFTQATGFPSIVNGHNWFNTYYDNMELHLRRVPTAHLCPPSDIEFFNFVETSWTNRGDIIRAFTDREAALKWLESIPTRTS